MISTRHRFATAAVLAACAAGLLTGCGDDDKKADDTPASTTTVDGKGDGQKASGASAEACTAYTKVSAAFGSEEPPDASTLSPVLDTLDDEAPSEIADSVAVMTDAARKVLDSNGEDTSAFDSPEFPKAQGEVEPYFFENCDFDTKLEVTAKEFAFEGIPETLKAGQVAMLLTNDGAEAHEMGIVKKKDGVTESFDDLLALPEEQAMDKVEMVNGTFVPRKGSQSMLVADLEPGDYMAVCFIPTGTTIDDSGEHEGSGPPHFVQGMKAEFTVS